MISKDEQLKRIEFGEKCRIWRCSHLIKLKDISRQINVSISQISKYERGLIMNSKIDEFYKSVVNYGN